MRFVSIANAVLLAILGATKICCAASADPPVLEGIFTNPTQSEEPIRTAVEATVKDLNFVIRPIARSRLKNTNSALKRVAINRDGNAITILLGTGNPTKTEPGRAPIKWTGDDGEVFDVSTEWQGSTLVQRLGAAEGQRENRYSLSADGITLTLNVILTSPRLKTPVQYQLSFRRETAK